MDAAEMLKDDSMLKLKFCHIVTGLSTSAVIQGNPLNIQKRDYLLGQPPSLPPHQEQHNPLFEKTKTFLMASGNILYKILRNWY